MPASPWPRRDPSRNRLLVVAGGTVADATIDALPGLLDPGDLLVVNDAATLPASLPGSGPAGEPVEWRLAGHPAAGLWWAIAFGAGDWHDDTDHRGPPPVLARGAAIGIAGIPAVVAAISPKSPRLVLLRPRVPEAAFWDAVYATGRPVQYRYVADDLPLDAVQTPWAGPPWAVEAPSAAFPLRWRVLDALASRGIRVATLTHAAGLSATGDPHLDGLLPLPERFDVPAATLAAVRDTREHGGRVLAVGTSAARALESAARGPRAGTTRLVLGPETRLLAVDGLLSNVHEPGEPHFRLMHAFAPAGLLLEAHARARDARYEVHEFGDAMLVLSSATIGSASGSAGSASSGPRRSAAAG
jgi:S-adenosylmethionine:tRNA ribosyltransferase-isomerase